MLLLATAALAANPYADRTSDVSAQRVIDAPPEALSAALRSTTALAAILPESCTVDWEHGVAPEGPARVTTQILAFKRRLTARITAADDQRVDLDHEGNKGFITRFLFEEAEGGTRVVLTTFLNPPGWPLRKYYFESVQPAWTACHVEALDRLAAKVAR